MTIREINSLLIRMSKGSKTNFLKYLEKIGIFNSWKTAQTAFYQYLICKPNSASFIKRQEISNAFDEWRYLYGDGVRGKQNKFDVIAKYNEKLQRYWDERIR